MINMMSTQRPINKMVPTLQSTCKVNILRITKFNDVPAESDYLLQEGEVSLFLEDADSEVDRQLVKFLMNTKLGDTGLFHSGGLSVELILMDIQYGVSIQEMKDEDKIARAKMMKDRGSELYRQGKYEEAFLRFRCGVQYVIFLTDKSLLEADDTYALLCNNMAMCRIKFGQHRLAAELCGKALKVQQTNVKALYRRAVCYAEMKKWREAHGDLMLACSVEKNNVSVMKLLEDVQKQLRVQHDEYKMVVKNMFR